MYRSSSLTTVARELVRHKLDFVGIQVRWDIGGMLRARDYIFFLWKRKQKSSTGNRIFVHQRIVSTVKTAEFPSDRVSYIAL
jgi:hypothetical protein